MFPRVFSRWLPGIATVVSLARVAADASNPVLESHRSHPLPPPRAPAAVAAGILDTIGNTPLIELRSLSALLGRRILAKAEHLNPGGSVKDRAALRIVDEFERKGQLVPRSRRAPGAPAGIIVEATGGNTGIGLALVAAARGYECVFTMPDRISADKVAFAELLGARVVLCPTAVPFTDPRHFYQHAAQLAVDLGPRAVLGNQFETDANWRAHYEGTGPEIIAQAAAAGLGVDALVVSAGTGGTIGGLSRCFRERSPRTRIFLIDPPGSSLYSWVTGGALAPTPDPTRIAEGVGIGRLTANFKAAGDLDGAFAGRDQEMVDMAHFLLAHEGLLVGPSAALNVCGAVKAARGLPPGSTVATVICDGGERYRARLFNTAWLESEGLSAPPRGGHETLDFVS